MTNKEIILWLIRHAQDTEWMTCHAAEDQYCPYCHKGTGWSSQTSHNEGCEYVKIMQLTDKLLQEQ